MTDGAWLRNSKEIAKYVGVSPESIKRLVDNEDFPAKIFYNRWRALKSDVDSWAKKKMRKENKDNQN